MKPGLDEKFLKHLLSKRKEIGPREYSFSRLNITPAEREKLYEIGEQCGLLTSYEFSGVESLGTNHNNAARRLLDKTHKRAFARLKTEFGSKTHFWVRPKELFPMDFYWRLARIGVTITGPLNDDLNRSGRTRTRDFRMGLLDDLVSYLPNFQGMTVLTFPYYVVWHHPTEFVRQIRQKLASSGRYPRLSAQG